MSYRKKHIKPKLKSLRHKKHVWQRRGFWWLCFLFVVMGGLAYVVFFLPQLQVREVSILGNESVEAEDLQKVIFQEVSLKIPILPITSKSILFTKSANIEKRILESFPSIEMVDIKKGLLGSLAIKVKQRVPVAVFCNNSGECFHIDSNGVIFESLQTLPAGKYIIKNSSVDNVSLGSVAVGKNIVSSLERIRLALKDNVQVEVVGAVLEDWLIVATSENWKIYFDPEQDMGLQIVKMNTLLKDQISTGERKNLEYIYLQYKDRAYYK